MIVAGFGPQARTELGFLHLRLYLQLFEFEEFLVRRHVGATHRLDGKQSTPTGIDEADAVAGTQRCTICNRSIGQVPQIVVFGFLPSLGRVD